MFVFRAAIIQTRVLRREIFVTGACSPLNIRLRMGNPRLWVEAPNSDRIAPIVAAVETELDYLRPSAFVVAKFGKSPVLDPDNMPKFDGTPEE